MQLYANELYHYGVKGQKWGVRRYQNPDGSYTQEGLSHYGRKSSSSSSKSPSNRIKRAAKEIQKRMDEREQKKPVHRIDNMTEDQLKRGIERLQKETQYLNLMNQKNRSIDELTRYERSSAAKKTDSTLRKMGDIALRVIEPAAIGLGIAFLREILTKRNVSDSVMNDVMSRFKKK